MQGALVDALEYDSRCQEKKLDDMETKVERLEAALTTISTFPVNMQTLRCINDIKQIADEALMIVPVG